VLTGTVHQCVACYAERLMHERHILQWDNARWKSISGSKYCLPPARKCMGCNSVPDAAFRGLSADRIDLAIRGTRIYSAADTTRSDCRVVSSALKARMRADIVIDGLAIARAQRCVDCGLVQRTAGDSRRASGTTAKRCNSSRP